MADPFRKVNPGDPIQIPAPVWNTILDSIKSGTGFGGGSGPPGTRQATIIRVKNESNTDLGRNKVIGLGGPIFTPTQSEDAFLREVTFRGETLSNSSHQRRYAVTLDPMKMGRVGRAYVAGVCQVKVDLRDPSHEFANMNNGTADHLVSSRHGHAQILWCEADEGYYGYDSGIMWAIVRLGVTMSCIAIGKAHGDISARGGTTYGSGEVDLYRGVGNSEDGPVERITVANASGDTQGAYGAGILDGKYVSVAWDADGTPWVAPLECP